MVMSGNGLVVQLPGHQAVIMPGATSRVAEFVEQHAPNHRIAVITDANVGPLYGRRVAETFGDRAVMFSIPSGEAAKTRETWAQITDDMLAAGFARDTTVVAIGGGVVGDLAGFVAATYMRGVPIVQVPTTLLAMIDASIGGKTGVDTPGGKNLVGAFHQPALVIIDPQTLATLPANHFRAGLAEALKHGVVASAEYFDLVATVRESTARDDATLLDVVSQSVRIKANVVLCDERESGMRKVLNFGHTIGHAIESVSNYRLLHGEAVAIGMTLEAHLAERLGIAEAGTATRIQDALTAIGLPTTMPTLDRGAVLSATRADKKARAGRVEYALPECIGSMAGAATGWATPVADADVQAILR
jgi:3-dehydroquinate synthase